MSEDGETKSETHVGSNFRRLELLCKNLKIITFKELCCCGDEVWIENEGEIYRLRKTRQGNLILTK